MLFLHPINICSASVIWQRGHVNPRGRYEIRMICISALNLAFDPQTFYSGNCNLNYCKNCFFEKKIIVILLEVKYTAYMEGIIIKYNKIQVES
jgi:hypothetical protein